MKTPDEIKKGLECCASVSAPCEICPFRTGTGAKCIRHMSECALAYIQQLEAAQPKWISVNERLPEPDRGILLIAHGWKERLLYIGCLHHMSAETSWLTGITSKESEWIISGWSYLKEPTVTHWMPLPEPPKEDA